MVREEEIRTLFFHRRVGSDGVLYEEAKRPGMLEVMADHGISIVLNVVI